jgi:hypothetical protein
MQIEWAMIEENAGNPIANQKKALRVRIISGHKYCRAFWTHLDQPQIKFETPRKFERFLSLSKRT